MSADLAAQTLAAIKAKRVQDYQMDLLDATVARLHVLAAIKSLRAAYSLVGARFELGERFTHAAECLKVSDAAVELAAVRVRRFRETGVMQ